MYFRRALRIIPFLWRLMNRFLYGIYCSNSMRLSSRSPCENPTQGTHARDTRHAYSTVRYRYTVRATAIMYALAHGASSGERENTSRFAWSFGPTSQDDSLDALRVGPCPSFHESLSHLAPQPPYRILVIRRAIIGLTHLVSHNRS